MNTYQINQKIVVSNSSNQILVLLHADVNKEKEQWSLPGGIFDVSQISTNSFYRKILEQIDILIDYIEPFFFESVLDNNVLIAGYRGYYRAGEVSLNEDFTQFKWLNKQEALRLNLMDDSRKIIEQWRVYQGRPESTQDDLLSFLDVVDDLGIKVWLDGGWGVDALLERQSRTHDDIDIVVEKKNTSELRRVLEKLGYQHLVQGDSSDWNFVLEDDFGHRVDFHVIEINEQGDGVYGPPQNGDVYPANSLKVVGKIGDREVNCLSAEYQLQSHTGYAPRASDYLDVKALCEKFELKMPKEFEAKEVTS